MLCGIFNPRNVLPLTERKRKPKFSKEELDILVTEVTRHEAVLFGRETIRLSHADRDKIWEGIARKVSSVSQVPRSVKDIKHRWDDMKRRTKDKLAFMRQSLSGPGIGSHTHPIILTAHERAIKSALLTARAGHGFPRAELDGTDSLSTSCEYLCLSVGLASSCAPLLLLALSPACLPDPLHGPILLLSCILFLHIYSVPDSGLGAGRTRLHPKPTQTLVGLNKLWRDLAYGLRVTCITLKVA